MSETQIEHGYECESCDEPITNIVEVIQHDCDPVRLSADSLSRRERNTLLYIENCVVDEGGKLDPAKMNYDDHQNIQIFEAAGLMQVADAQPDPDKPRMDVRQVGHFSDEAWDLTRDCRQMRAAQDDRVDFAVGCNEVDS